MARCAAAFLRSPVLICAGLVQMHQRHVDAVATALLREGHLDAMGIRRILGRRTMSVRSVIFIALCALGGWQNRNAAAMGYSFSKRKSYEVRPQSLGLGAE